MIKSIAQLNLDQKKMLEDIFWLTSAKNVFLNEEEKYNFLYKYFKMYVENYAETSYAFLDGDKACGYILCSPSSNYLKDIFSFYSSENEIISIYPAHLHMNTHPGFQGRGIGAKLIKALVEKLKSINISGLHLVTAKDARNVDFYIKNAFTILLKSNQSNPNLLFLGMRL